MVWRQRTCVTNYVDQQTLKQDDDLLVLQPNSDLGADRALQSSQSFFAEYDTM